MRSFLALFALLCLGACSATGGNQANERQFEVAAFDQIDLSGPFDVVVTQGETASVRAEGDPRLLQLLNVFVQDGWLRAEGDREAWDRVPAPQRVTLHVTAPAIRTVTNFAEGSSMRIGRMSGPLFEATVDGGGSITLEDVQAQSVRLFVGAGTMRASGRTDSLQLTSFENGTADLARLEAARATLTTDGSGTVTLRATGQVAISGAGTGTVTVTGGAQCQNTRTGTGRVNCG